MVHRYTSLQSPIEWGKLSCLKIHIRGTSVDLFWIMSVLCSAFIRAKTSAWRMKLYTECHSPRTPAVSPVWWRFASQSETSICPLCRPTFQQKRCNIIVQYAPPGATRSEICNWGQDKVTPKIKAGMRGLCNWALCPTWEPDQFTCVLHFYIHSASQSVRVTEV